MNPNHIFWVDSRGIKKLDSRRINKLDSLDSRQPIHRESEWIRTVAHKCHGKLKNSTAN